MRVPRSTTYDTYVLPCPLHSYIYMIEYIIPYVQHNHLVSTVDSVFEEKHVLHVAFVRLDDKRV